MFISPLAEEILEVLLSTDYRLTAKEILAWLRAKGVAGRIDKSDVNSALFSELAPAGIVRRDDCFRWTLTDLSASEPSSAPAVSTASFLSRGSGRPRRS